MSALAGRVAAGVLLLAGAGAVLWGEGLALAEIGRARATLAEARARREAPVGLSAAARLAAVRTLVGGAVWRLDGMSAELLSARLQQAVQEDAVAAGAAVTATRVMPAREVDGLQVVGLEVQLQADDRQLHDVLERVEALRPRLFVERLAVAVPEAADGPPHLAVTLGLAAYGVAGLR